MANFKFKIKRNTSNPASGTLDIGELGYNTSSKVLFIGNGTGNAASAVSMDGHLHSLASLTDTTISSPQNGQILVYNSTSGKWENDTISLTAGTVTSVGLSLPNIFSVSGSPVTGSGTLTAALATQAVNFVFAGPGTGSSAAPTFRALVAADIPTLNQNTTGNAGSATLIATTQKSDNVNYQVPFVTSVTAGNQAVHTDSVASITFNPSTDILNVPNLTVTGNLTVNNVEMISTSNGIIFEGSTNDANETTLTAIDPTADRTISLPNASGTVALTSQLPAAANNATLTLAASTGISLSATPTFTADASVNKTITITNSAPDQTVSLTGAGTVSVSGTYPSFTITGSGGASGDFLPLTGGTLTGNLNISNTGPVITLKDSDSTGASQLGYLSFQDSGNTEKAWLGFGSSGNTNFTISNEYSGGFINLLGGNVGIGTDSPSHKLHISDTNPRVTLQGTGAGNNVGYRFTALDSGSASRVGGYYFQPITGTNQSYLGLTATDSAYQMIVRADGNVGIGTTTPDAKLDVDGGVDVRGNIRLTGPVTTANQARTIEFTGFDKEGTNDFSDAAFIRHTTNTAGHTGSVLLISSQNDSNDGISFETNASSALKHNGFTIVDAQASGFSNWSGAGTIGAVVGMLAWKNYGNNHVIFDASNSTSPSGSSVNSTNSQVAWSASYPTLMGWNGSSTYGVRVDSARISDVTAAVDWGNVTNKPAFIMFYQGFTLDANTMTSNSTGFTYSNNAPATGPIARFSAGGSYDLWLNAPYSGGGNELYFRTRNGDNGTLNSWKRVWHDGNFAQNATNNVSGGLKVRFASGTLFITNNGNDA